MKILCFDVGGTFIKYALAGETGDFYYSGKIPTPLDSFENFINSIEPIVDKYKSQISGLAFSIPGTIDVEKGYVYQGGSLRYNDKRDFVKDIETRFNFPTTVENDARCAALAEVWKGNLKNVKDALVMVFGTGIGGAIVKDGKIHRGHHLYAGEFSVIMAKGKEKYEFLGNQGGIPRFVERVSKQLGDESLTGEEVFNLISKNNLIATKAFEEYLENLAYQIFNLQMIYDPELVLIGGGVSANKVFMDGLNEAVENFYKKIPIPIRHSILEVCKFHNKSNLLGAIYHFLKQKNIDL